MSEVLIKQILVPTDFSEVGDCAILHGIELAKLFKDELSIIHVIDGTTKKIFKEEPEQTANNKLKAFSEKIQKDHNIKVNIYCIQGSIFETINKIAKDINATLVVMGTHGKKGVQHIIGSYALKVIGGSEVPYVIVQKTPPIPDGYKNIILPLDTTQESKQKVMWALLMTKSYKCKIHVLAANESDPFLAKKVKNNIVYTKKQFEKEEVDFELHLAEKGGIEKSIIAFAKKINAGLIIITTTRLYGIGDYIIGPIEQKVITNSEEIPVMCINPRELYIAGGIKG